MLQEAVGRDNDTPAIPISKWRPSTLQALLALATPRSRGTPRLESESQLTEARQEHVILLSPLAVADPEEVGITDRRSQPAAHKVANSSDHVVSSPGATPAPTPGAPDFEDFSITVDDGPGPSKRFVPYSGLIPGSWWPGWIAVNAKGQLAKFNEELTMLLAVSALIISLAFGSVLQPPGGIKTSEDGNPNDHRKVGTANLIDTDSSSFRIFFIANGSAMAAASFAVVLLLTVSPKNDVQAFFINKAGRTLVWLAVQAFITAFSAAVWIISGRNKTNVLPFWIAAGFLYFFFTSMFAFQRLTASVRSAKKKLQDKMKARKVSRIRGKLPRSRA